MDPEWMQHYNIRENIRAQLPDSLRTRLAIFLQADSFVVLNDVHTGRMFRCCLLDDGRIPDTFLAHLCVVV
jgi:hypothetical protein